MYSTRLLDGRFVSVVIEDVVGRVVIVGWKLCVVVVGDFVVAVVVVLVIVVVVVVGCRVVVVVIGISVSSKYRGFMVFLINANKDAFESTPSAFNTDPLKS